jgi:hypothetical protein
MRLSSLLLAAPLMGAVQVREREEERRTTGGIAALETDSDTDMGPRLGRRTHGGCDIRHRCWRRPCCLHTIDQAHVEAIGALCIISRDRTFLPSCDVLPSCLVLALTLAHIPGSPLHFHSTRARPSPKAIIADTDSQALHFYFESNEKRCFLEELPSDTIVEGAFARACGWLGAGRWFTRRWSGTGTGTGTRVEMGS